MADTAAATSRHTNHLAGESSPYLLSHAHNPVDWYPWNDEALAKAKKLNRPIFLSIGYAACHWCHVMERESFENEQIARILNEHFISIKIDREQRPDLDQIYMTFTQAMTGSGGWPMSIFLTPDLKPFFAGTYFPPDDRYGRPGFMKVITEIARAYDESPSHIVESAQGIFEEINKHLARETDSALLSQSMVAAGAESLMKSFDHVHGGFGQVPKFPHAVELSLFLRHYRRTGDLAYLLAVEKALTSMAHGGVYDQIGGGFARYSTDERWLVPHFEKMLYDNALLVSTYTEAYQITGKDEYRGVVRETLDFLLREMTDSSGGFYSALDADSEGEEGRFYLWTESEIRGLLSGEADPFLAYFNVTATGNFEGRNILHVDAASERISNEQAPERFNTYLEKCKARLLQARGERVRPLTDDKILSSWNGLALSACARGYQITLDQKYLAAAIANAHFVEHTMYRDNTLTHAYRQSVHSGGEFLEDYAFYVRGLLDLYETDPGAANQHWLELAVTMARHAVALFLGADNRFYLRPDNQPDLIVRPKDEIDNAIPSAGSIMIHNLFKLHRLTEDAAFLDAAERALKTVSGQMSRYPGGMASALLALDYMLNDKVEIVVVGNGPMRDAILAEIYRRYSPNRLLAISPSGTANSPLFEGRAANGQVKAFVCVNSVCRLPAVSVDELRERLAEIR
ncbi:MAG: thioredoxin domain-containing protein [Candidatus Zixiibacteriota bacterium]